MPSRSILETYDYLRRIRAGVEPAVPRRCGRRSHNEEEFRIAASQRITHVAAELEIELVTRHEYTLAAGRADAVYNHHRVRESRCPERQSHPRRPRHAVGHRGRLPQGVRTR